MDARGKTRREIAVFLALTMVLSAFAYVPIIRAGTINDAQSKLAGLLMLAPGLAAVITYLAYERSLRPVGWRLGKIQYLALGLVLPVGYCMLGYGLSWLTSWAKYNGQFSPDIALLLPSFVFNGTLSAVLEEVGWRGFLVPKMFEVTSFSKTSLMTGLIWVAWHCPLVIYSNVRLGNAPLPYSLMCFTVFVVGLSFAASWLRLKSGSIWSAAVLHGSHNVFMLHVFNVLTSDSGRTWFLLGEYGAVAAVIGIVLATVFAGLGSRLAAMGHIEAKNGGRGQGEDWPRSSEAAGQGPRA